MDFSYNLYTSKNMRNFDYVLFEKKGCVNIVFLNVLWMPDAIKSLFFISLYYFKNKDILSK